MTSLLPDAIATSMQRLRIAIITAEHAGEWARANRHREELKKLHDLVERREAIALVERKS